MSANTLANTLVVCEDCDAVHRRQDLSSGVRARCRRCDGELYRHHHSSFDGTIALAMSGLIAFVIANIYPVIWITVQGATNSATLWQAILAPERYGLGLVSVLVAVMAFFAPLLQLLLTLYIAVPLNQGRRPAGFVNVMHALRHLRPWGMVEVFMLGALVAVAKLAGLADVAPGIGLWGFVALTVLMTVLLMDDPHRFWAAGDGCTDEVTAAQAEPL